MRILTPLYRIDNFLSTVSWTWQLFSSFGLLALGAIAGWLARVPVYVLLLLALGLFFFGLAVFHIARIGTEPRRQLDAFFDSFLTPAFEAARRALGLIANRLKLAGNTEIALSYVITTAVITPAEEAFAFTQTAFQEESESPRSMQERLGELCIRYRLMQRSIEASFPVAQETVHMSDEAVISWGGRNRNTKKPYRCFSAPLHQI